MHFRDFFHKGLCYVFSSCGDVRSKADHWHSFCFTNFSLYRVRPFGWRKTFEANGCFMNSDIISKFADDAAELGLLKNPYNRRVLIDIFSSNEFLKRPSFEGDIDSNFEVRNNHSSTMQVSLEKGWPNMHNYMLIKGESGYF